MIVYNWYTHHIVADGGLSLAPRCLRMCESVKSKNDAQRERFSVVIGSAFNYCSFVFLPRRELVSFFCFSTKNGVKEFVSSTTLHCATEFHNWVGVWMHYNWINHVSNCVTAWFLIFALALSLHWFSPIEIWYARGWKKKREKIWRKQIQSSFEFKSADTMGSLSRSFIYFAHTILLFTFNSSMKRQDAHIHCIAKTVISFISVFFISYSIVN